MHAPWLSLLARRSGPTKFSPRSEPAGWVKSIALATHVRVFQNLNSASYDVFPDGQRFILALVKAGSLHTPLTLVENWPSELKK